MSGNLSLTLKIWRQPNAQTRGRFETYQLDDVSPDMSFLEMLDVLNEQLIKEGQEPVAFDHDCREGICGACGMMINGQAHGPEAETTTCQLHMRRFRNGDTIVIEPWRARAFPVVRDLVVDRSAFDRIMTAGGYISVNTGNAPDANAILVPKDESDRAMNAAACIGCGACVAACKNASAMLFVSAKVSHLALLPQGKPERREPRRLDDRPDGQGRLRRLHRHRRVRGRLPRGHFHQQYRPAQPRISEVHVRRRQVMAGWHWRLVRQWPSHRDAARRRRRASRQCTAIRNAICPNSPNGTLGRRNPSMLRTACYSWHVAHGGRMVDFAGWEMPVQYASIIEEHQAVRQAAGLFDIAHMGRIKFTGDGACGLLDLLLTNDVTKLKPGDIRYSLVVNDRAAFSTTFWSIGSSRFISSWSTPRIA